MQIKTLLVYISPDGFLSSMHTISIAGEAFRHCLYSNNPLPPTSISTDIHWKWDAPDPTFFVDAAIPTANATPERSIAWLIEPYDLIPHIYDWVIANNHRFRWVFTHEKTLLQRGDNYRLIPYGGCWISESRRGASVNKTRLVSIISSGKNQLSGHVLRHDIIRRFPEIDVYGNGYRPIKGKETALEPYLYSVSIENCKRDYWFTEKLVDCFMTRTIPIYWGCPSIDHFFNPKGILSFDTMDELTFILEMIKFKGDVFYQESYQYVLENYHKAQRYVLAENTIYLDYIKSGLIE